MKDQTAKYIHTPHFHNLEAPAQIVPYLIDTFHPQSVADIGCGIGTFLHLFLQNGVQEVLGVDGNWVNRSKLLISENFFLEKDLEKEIGVNKKFDIVLCLEVGEHLPDTAADTLIDSLVQLGNIIVFSAAIKNQGGQNHINEQPFKYWIEKFENKGFFFYDIFRQKFWNNEKVNWWYKQNMFLVVHNSVNVSQYGLDIERSQTILEYVHPDLLAVRTNEVQRFRNELNRLKQGRGSIRFYLHLLRKKFFI